MIHVVLTTKDKTVSDSYEESEAGYLLANSRIRAAIFELDGTHEPVGTKVVYYSCSNGLLIVRKDGNRRKK